MLIRNAWYPAAQPGELEDGLVARTVLGEPLVIGRLASGGLLVVADRCPHRYLPLSLGRIEGESIRCAYHGACFDADGACVEVPGQDVVPPSARVKSYPVRERHGFIWVWMGDPAASSDESTIPEFLFRGDHADWDGGYGCFESIQAGYQLINDNLIDITHAEFVHPESFGTKEVRLYRDPVRGDEYIPNRMTYSADNRGITFRMRVPEIGGDDGPFYRWMVSKGLGREQFEGPVDLDMEVHWLAPAITSFVLNSRPAGAPPEQGFGVCNMHLVTPETETSSHYFYKSVKDFGDRELTAQFMEGVRAIFAQDRPILEAQQRRVGSVDLFEQRPVSFGGDMLQLKARKTIQDLVDAEQVERGI